MKTDDEARAKADAAEPHRATKQGTTGGNARDPGAQQSSGKPPDLIQYADFIANFTPPEYIIDGIIRRSGLYSITAPTGHGKTAVALCFNTHLATGRNLKHREVEQGSVVYFAAETPDDVKARAIFIRDRLGLDPKAVPLYFVEGGFNLSDWAKRIADQVERIGGAIAITVDTGPSFLVACGFADENDNMQALKFALQLRELTKLPGRPTVLVPTHPIKNASRENLLPRGGSAMLNEMDGNLTLWAEGERETTELHWAGKLRGPTFDPLTFALEKGTSPKLVDHKDRPIPSVWAYEVDQARAERSSARQMEDEDSLLVLMFTAPDHSQAKWAELLGWRSSSGEPLKSRVSRTLDRLKTARLVEDKRGRWTLTRAGNAEVKRLQGQAQ